MDRINRILGVVKKVLLVVWCAGLLPIYTEAQAQENIDNRAIRTPQTVKITPAMRMEAAKRASQARDEAEAKTEADMTNATQADGGGC